MRAKIHKSLGGGWYRTTTSWINENTKHLKFKNRIVPILGQKDYTERVDGRSITVKQVRINDNPEYLEDFEFDT